MRQFIISEERLKEFIRCERELSYAHESMLYCPSEEELEPTEEDFEEFTEIKEHEFIPDIDEDFANTLKKMINKLNQERVQNQ